ncbi:MAG: camphor resistance protein CrcB [gamma proteobacterium symbiont of Ctena orbiculata]|nr:MAG: camphor resistance protein CrcB [gamma proteobacterium symbiont of Ctena orbiculata]
MSCPTGQISGTQISVNRHRVTAVIIPPLYQLKVSRLNQLIAIASGGAAGALFRFWVSTGVYGLLGRGFPYGTLVVNVLGSLVMGFLYVLLLERTTVSPELRGALLIGFLGAFTTFSTFSIETLNLLEQAELLKAGMNILLSVVACVLACWFGLVVGRQL